MNPGQIVGVVLIAVGALWMFMVFFFQQRRGARAQAAGPWDVLLKIVERLPTPYLPGALMIIVGALLLGLT